MRLPAHHEDGAVRRSLHDLGPVLQCEQGTCAASEMRHPQPPTNAPNHFINSFRSSKSKQTIFVQLSAICSYVSKKNAKHTVLSTDLICFAPQLFDSFADHRRGRAAKTALPSSRTLSPACKRYARALCAWVGSSESMHNSLLVPVRND